MTRVAENVLIRRGYVDVAGHQLHYRVARPAEMTPAATPIVCLHQTPTSSIEFEALIRELAVDRLVFAPDMPGYGGSDGPAEPQTLEYYADMLAGAVQASGTLDAGTGRPVLYGYHSGAVMAAQIALSHSSWVAGIVLHGFPFRPMSERLERIEALPRNLDLEIYFEKVQWYYEMHVRRGPESMPLHERTRNFAQDMIAGPRYWFAYDAVWRWPYDERLRQIKVPSLAIAADEMLREPTIAASRLIPGCELLEMPEVKGGSALLLHAADLAPVVCAFAERVGRAPY
jgi:pimeloyl-ACP methyl ester carboxylesterase